MSNYFKNDFVFNMYNLVVTLLFTAALVFLVARSPYREESFLAGGQVGATATATGEVVVDNQVAETPEEGNQQSNTQLPEEIRWLLFTLLTLLAAGGLGGVLCNLRGIFKYHRARGYFPERFKIPFIIRPWMGAAVGLLTFFVASLLNSALSNAASNSWQTLSGRIPFIGLAVIAGFGSQEFMERMKEVAKTLFQEVGPEEAPVLVEQIATWNGAESRWVMKDPTQQLDKVGQEELIILIGDLLGDGELHWHIFQPGERVSTPKGSATAIRVRYGNIEQRIERAYAVIELAFSSYGVLDWRKQGIADLSRD